MQLAIIFGYLFLMLLIGIIYRKRASGSPIEFFLAGRKLTPVLLFFTMAATNFSAFTIFGLSGAGYRIGYAFYPIMGFGTGFMALSFIIIGGRILKLSRERQYVTPSDFVSDRYRSPLLKLVFSGILVLFTLPYIAIQTIASGKSLNSLTGMPYLTGALLITLFIALYVGLGGLRSIAWTDVIQGVMMVIFTLVAFFIIARGAGGFVGVHEKLLETNPEHLSRPGAGEVMLPGIWIGYLVLWFFADPMFPQLFQRFIAAKDENSLRWTVILYPIITTGLFFLTVSIGVIGKAVFPNLPAEQTDTIFPLLLKTYTGEVLSALLLTGSLAALMSTLDSQLLTVTSIITRDFPHPRLPGRLYSRLIISLLALTGFIIAINPPATILGFINKTTFNGLAVLAPTILGGLYWKRGNTYGALGSILVGEVLVMLFYFSVLAVPGILPVIPILTATILAYTVISLLTPGRKENTALVYPPKGVSLLWVGIFLLLFILGNDFWNWNKTPDLFLGLPGWVWYFFALGFILSGVYAIFFKRIIPLTEKGNRQ